MNQIKELSSVQDFNGKKVLVMGLGLHGGGVGTIAFLAKHGAEIRVTDLRSRSELKESLKKLRSIHGIRYILGKHRKNDFLWADLIIKNPGVKPHSPYLKFAKKHGVPVTSDIGIFFRFCPATIIGVTGSKGKSTVAFLIWKFLRTKTKKVFLGGNIRTSVFDFFDRLNKKSIVVLELSSFQLEDLTQGKISPHIAVFTNLFCDHINWHGSFQKYKEAKKNIVRFQKKNDYLFANTADREVKLLLKNVPSQMFSPKLASSFKKIVDKNLGRQYRNTVALACGVGKLFRISKNTMRHVLKNFYGLEGRQELIGRHHGITVINDTTATVPEATVEALKRFRALTENKNLILIAGGEDKNLRYERMADAIQRFADAAIFLSGSATQKIVSELKKAKAHKKIIIRHAKTMQSAVKIAYQFAQKGDWILLSPGAASFGLFAHEFDRGKQFIDAIRNIYKVYLRRSLRNTSKLALHSLAIK